MRRFGDGKGDGSEGYVVMQRSEVMVMVVG